MLEYNRIAGRANAAIIEFAKPTIAMIQGYCIGGGLGVALCCDLRLTAEGSTFAVPAANSGSVTPMTGSSGLSTSSVHPSPRRSFIRRDSSTRRRPCNGAGQSGGPGRGIETYVRDYAGTIGGNAPLTINSVKLCVNEATKDPDKRNLAAAQARSTAVLRRRTTSKAAPRSWRSADRHFAHGDIRKSLLSTCLALLGAVDRGPHFAAAAPTSNSIGRRRRVYFLQLSSETGPAPLMARLINPAR